MSAEVITQRRVAWPEPVREYVRRNFAQESWVELGISRTEYEEKLKTVISEAQRADSLDTTDWKNMPSIYQYILNERNQHNALRSYRPTSPSHRYASAAYSDPSMSRLHLNSVTSPIKESSRPMQSLTSLSDRITQGKSESRRKGLKRSQRDYDGWNGDSKRSRSRSPKREAPGPVVGRSTQLERRYLRLTAAPDPGMVRPLPVLRQTLQLLKNKWREENNYSYICEQFKSLRQDLTVQHIKNDFTTDVYEVHARIALEKGDLGEFNQCQTQLKTLYAHGLGGKPTEFLAYRILYTIHTNNMMNMNDLLASLTATEKSDPAVQHALQVRAASAAGNYHKLFRLYQSAPNMNAYLMDVFVVRERLRALAAMTKSYMTMKLRFITDELGFESDQEAVDFLAVHRADGLLQHDKEKQEFLIDCRPARALFAAAAEAAFRRIDIKGQI